jgi:hypothetical protein
MVIEAKLAEASRFVPLPEVAHSEVRSAAIPLRGNLILNRAPFFLVGPQANSSAAAVNCASDWIYEFFQKLLALRSNLSLGAADLCTRVKTHKVVRYYR